MAGRPRARILLHCGAPKTGSTSLQSYFRDQEAALAAAGIAYPHRFFSRGDVDPLHRAFVRSRRAETREVAIGTARARLEELLAAPGLERVLISNESLLGEPFVEAERGFFPQARTALAALARIFEGYRVEVRFVIRDFAAYLPSYYVQYIRRGGCLSFNDYLTALEPETLSWHGPSALLADTFGAQRLQVVDHGALSQDAARMLEGFLDAPLAPFKPARYRLNRSAGAPALAVARQANRLLTRLYPNAPRTVGRVTRTAILKPLSFITPARKPQLPADLRRKLDARYAEERAALTAEWKT